MKRLLSGLFAGLVALMLPSQVAAQVELRIQSDIRISCLTVNGLVENANRVTNIMQVLNNERTIWHSKNGCTTNTRRLVGDTFVGWYDTGRFLIAIAAIHMENVPDAPPDPNKKPCRFGCVKITNARDQMLFRPVYILNSNDLTTVMPLNCLRSRATVKGVTLFGTNRVDCRPPNM
jgi:hypothetical protein